MQHFGFTPVAVREHVEALHGTFSSGGVTAHNLVLGSLLSKQRH